MTACRRHLGRLAVLLVVAALGAPAGRAAARAHPASATVLVRLIGQVRVLRGEDERAWRERLLDLSEVEVGTGSGFIISPEGWIVTNHHVVSGEKSTILVQGQTLEVSIAITAIEVILPEGVGGQAPRRLPASVYAVDEARDLALLRVTGGDLPYVALGDSDAVAPGDAVTAIGYPFGDLHEIDKPAAAAPPAGASVSSGNVSNLRGDAAGERRLLQITAPLNPGNSGGPVADHEGYAVGVAQSRLENAVGIGFAIPINHVKRLLQSHGLDAVLPVTLHTMGTQIASTTKGLRLNAPVGFEDRSPQRLRLDAASTSGRTSRVADAADDDLALRVDRLATPQSLEQIERALLNDAALEPFTHRGAAPSSSVRRDGDLRVLAGQATGTHAVTGAPAKLVYLIVDLGREKVVARYAGTADTIAANRSLLQTSLASLEVSRLLVDEIARTAMPRWLGPRALGTGMEIAMIDGWVVEPGAPWSCDGSTPRSTDALTMSPAGDFTVGFRAAWRDGPPADAAAAARACSPQPGVLGERSYSARATSWGVAYQVDGVFFSGPGGLWQLEMIAPLDKRGFAADLFADWVRAFAR